MVRRHPRPGHGPRDKGCARRCWPCPWGWCVPPAARAQSSFDGIEASDDELSLERIVAGVADLLFSLADSASEKVFDFLETVELFDFERRSTAWWAIRGR